MGGLQVTTQLLPRDQAAHATKGGTDLIGTPASFVKASKEHPLEQIQVALINESETHPDKSLCPN